MTYGHLVVAYHGCDITTRDGLVTGAISHLTPSANLYDWLGPGSYFFENDYDRALVFAKTVHKNPALPYTKRPIATPSVVGALIRVQHCLDMTQQAGIREFVDARDVMVAMLEATGEPLPENLPMNDADQDVIQRNFDCAVISMLHGLREVKGLNDYQLIRGAFRQGDPVATNSGFHEQTHIQLALRDPACVLGWFLPETSKLQTQKAHERSQQKLQDAISEKAAAKIRIRVSVDQA